MECKEPAPNSKLLENLFVDDMPFAKQNWLLIGRSLKEKLCWCYPKQPADNKADGNLSLESSL